MIARRHQVALALTVVLTSAAACQAREHQSAERPGRPAPSAARGFTLVASGDILPHTSVIDRARFDAADTTGIASTGSTGGMGSTGSTGYDFRPMLSGIEPVVSRADLALCHMETVYGANGDYTGYPAFKSPPEIAQALAATGYDGCSTASNHSLDDGAAGVQRTLDALDGAGVRHAGTARTQAEATAVTLLRAGPARVAHLAYTYDTNGYPFPPGQPWTVNLIDENRIVADARAARKAGADVVVVSLHWGTEWQDAPDDRQLTLARTLTASRTDGRPDIDLILGTHAHVPQAYEKVNGTWVVYGMGDQIAGEMSNYQGVQDPRGNQSTIARFTFAPPTRHGARWEVRKAEFVPQMFDIDAGRVINLNQALTQGAGVEGVRDRIRDVVLSRGAAKDGLVMGE
ncbi:CapA family protein [Streptomyces sp. yr375]|uniref:CapA family protein n=1 Tax=Streptomyces sp. yr375 TaxID=1761906 RepID=UPI000B8162DC|nr:CapA family protein [Streptomyces sp. yr375]